MQIVAVIGGGFSGTMVAVNIARLSGGKVKIYLIEKTGEFARGVAYGTKNLMHLLNVPAERMSAFADDPLHFVKWLGKTADGKKFYPRKVYGDYIADILATAGADIEMITGEVDDVINDDGKFRLNLNNGGVIEADIVVLAVGNLPPVTKEREKGLEKLKDRVFFNPWAQVDRLEKISDDAKILIIGTGLTMVDMVVTLTAEKPERKIIAVSRHGLLPQPHTNRTEELKIQMLPETSVLKIMRILRSKIIMHAQNNVPWQNVFDGFRPLTVNIWRSLAVEEKRKFVVNLKTYWDTHRHRMSEEIFARLAKLQQTGQLRVKAGRVLDMKAMEKNFAVTIKARGAETAVVEEFDYIVNCATPEVNYKSTQLMKNLFERGMVQEGVLKMGVKTTVDGRVVSKDGSESQNIFALGPLCKGELWETIAVPELRVQAQNLANLIIGKL